MPYKNVPTSGQVADELGRLGSRATAYELCQALVARGFPRRDSQLAIQRAADAKAIEIGADWTLSVCLEAVAA